MHYDGVAAADLASRLTVPSLAVHATLTSALDRAHDLAAAGAPSGAMVLADEQTAGRGRQGRVWHSPAGTGIWLAVIGRPAQAPAGGAWAVRVGLRVRDAMADVAPAAAPRLKWPNDVMVRGAKVGGVLCEARWSGERLSWIIAGIGINVHGPVPAAVRGSAVALDEVVPGAGRVRLLESLARHLRALDAAPAALTAGERRHFLQWAWSPPGERAAADIEPDGTLVVPRADGSLDRRSAPA